MPPKKWPICTLCVSTKWLFTHNFVEYYYQNKVQIRKRRMNDLSSTQNPCSLHTDPCRSHADPVQIPCKPRADPVQTPCRPCEDPLQTPCRPHVDPVQTPCEPRADPVGQNHYTCPISSSQITNLTCLTWSRQSFLVWKDRSISLTSLA